jgi:hypothetical protein
MSGQIIDWQKYMNKDDFTCISCLLFQPGHGPVGVCLFSGKGRYDRSKACRGIVTPVTQAQEGGS